MMQSATSTAPVPVSSYTAKAQRHKDGSVLLSIADDRICKLNGVGALTWMILEENPAGLGVDEIAQALSEQFKAINAEGQLLYEVSPEQLGDDTERFLKKLAEVKLLQMETDSRGQEFYYIKEGVSGTTSSTAVAAVSRATPATSSSPQSIESQPSGTAESPIRLSKRETFTAFIALLTFDLLLKLRGFQSLIKKVEHWPIAEPHTTDFEICRRVRAMVDRAQMYYPKKAMCLQRSAVITCLLRSRGLPAQMVLGAQEYPIKGHAWAEVSGLVVNDNPGVKTKYRELRRI
ncbi:MAG TPA: lasso peptide biosynthesis B2 protein [Pyrinomonadaceae bacterium]